MRLSQGVWVPSPRRSASALGLLLLAYSLCRVEFWFLNRGAFEEIRLGEMALVFLQGLRFDLSFLLLWNLWFLLLEWLPQSPRGWRRFLRERLAVRLLFFWNVPPLILNLIDSAYFEFSGRRSTWSVLALWRDIVDQAWQLAFNFWYVTFLCLFGAGLGWFAWRRWVMRRRSSWRLSWGPYLCGWLLLCSAVPFGIRSGLQTKPLGTWHAFVFSNTALGALALNTPFNLVHTERREQLKKLHFFADEDEARTILGHDERLKAAYPSARDNVVLIVLESFGLEHFGFGKGSVGYMPFLRSLAEKGISIEQTYANGRRSIDALASILCSIPSLMDEPYVTSNYNSTSVHGLGEALSAYGYDSSFFHGGRNGTMYLDVMSRLCGFKRYYGMNEYPNNRDYDGSWGILDEPFLQWAAGRISEQPQPFISGIFTLSSHNPYVVPEGYAGRFPKGSKKIHESLGYADYALQRFFEEAAKHSWYKNTLFVLTADHSAEEIEKRFHTDLGRNRIPLIFFHPGRRLAIPPARSIAQQTDIMPSILDLLGIGAREMHFAPLPFGRSLFDATARPRVINRIGGMRWMISGEWVVRARVGTWDFRVERLDADGFGSHPVSGFVDEKERAIAEMKALLQIYHNGLLANRLYVESASHAK